MQMKYLKAVAACLALVCNASYAGVIIPVEAPGKSEPTLTLLMEAGKPATATVLFIPGGDGRTNLKKGITEPSGPFFVGILKPLTRSTFNVVLVDDPDGINFQTGYSPDGRLDRIESVLKYYHSKLKTPIILFGHSHGSPAVMRLVNRSAEIDPLISGIVLSSSRVGTRIERDVGFPILFMNHIADGCENTPYSAEVKHFEQLKERKLNVTFATIDGGQDASPPCEAGHHMYYKSYEKVVDAMQKFLPK